MNKVGNVIMGAAAMALASGMAPSVAHAGDGGAFLGGLAVGVIGSAIVNGAGSNSGYGPGYGPGYGQNYGYRPTGFYGAPVYQRRHCWFAVEPVYGLYGQLVGERRVRQCGY